MDTTKYLIIGGGVAGGMAAKQIRTIDNNSPITIVSSEQFVPYHRPPLSKGFLRGEKKLDEIYVEPKSFYDSNDIQLLLGTSIKTLNPEAKTVTCTGHSTISFEKALIATGGEPIRLDLPGKTLQGIHYLRTLDDSLSIGREVTPERRAVIVGGGFIGMEVAASLTMLGVDVTVVEAQPYIWKHFVNPEMARFFQTYCMKKGIDFITDDQVVEIRGEERVTTVVTKKGKKVSCDFVCIGVGINPRFQIALQAGLIVNKGVIVNEYLQTSHPDIYAAGDIADFPDPYFQKHRRVEHWGLAEYTGKLAGKNMTGAADKFDLLTYVFSEIFDLHLEFAGDETDYQETILRGSFEDRTFILMYLKGDKLNAYFAVNTDEEELAPLNNLIKSRQSIKNIKKQLADTSTKLGEISEAEK